MARNGRRTLTGPEGKAGGTYALVCPLPHQSELRVGRLGVVTLEAGWYVYVGSAHGPGGVAARVARHLRQEKRSHWHIDHLLRHAAVTEVWTRYGSERVECQWALEIARAEGATLTPMGFGSSDCHCPGHLVHFAHQPASQLFRALSAQCAWAFQSRP